MEIIRKSEEKRHLTFDKLEYGDVFYYVEDMEKILFLKGFDVRNYDCQIDLRDGSAKEPNLLDKVIIVKGSFIEE